MGIKNVRAQFHGLYSQVWAYKGAYTIGAVTTGTQVTQTLTIPGIQLSDIVDSVSWDTSIGALWTDVHVTGTNTVTVVVGNSSGGTITPTAGNIYVLCARPDPSYFN